MRVPVIDPWVGPGDALRAPLAITVIGGLLGATVLTLVVIPCLYRSLTPGAPPAKPEALTETDEAAA